MLSISFESMITLNVVQRLVKITPLRSLTNFCDWLWNENPSLVLFAFKIQVFNGDCGLVDNLSDDGDCLNGER